MKNVLIVESPAKAKTINKYLGKDYVVLASFGHIRDLPSKNGSVDIEKNFEMKYQTNPKSTKHVKQIVDAMSKADKLILAPDPDREGEAIAWHVVETLKNKKVLTKDKKVERVVFNAITKNAILEAIKTPREIDMDLVNAQQARRALDYLVGFNLSPVLWKKLPGSKSAGRVQSVALRLICEREKEIEIFKPQEYWDIEVDLKTNLKQKLIAKLTHIQDKKLEKFDIVTEKQAKEITKILNTKKYRVSDIEKKQTKRKPFAPFTTSTLQQEASKKLGFSAKKTMMVAQRLYEGVDVGNGEQGLITYMRTDGVYTAPEAIKATRDFIQKSYGDKYLPKQPVIYKSKIKNAQEAHEAIRPTDPLLKPESIKKYLENDQLRLYDLIWKRLIASQMSDVILDQVVVIIITESEYGLLRSSGSVINFDGFYRVYQNDDEEEDKKLPKVEPKEELMLIEVLPKQHFTEPSARYSEATLVKKMEELGIGRPSTYASIISVLQDRDYVKLEKKRFIPEERGRIVTEFLKRFFSKYVEYNYTAELENDLDEISNGKKEWKGFLDKFWKEFHCDIGEVSKISNFDIAAELNKILAPHLFGYDENNELKNKCSKCGKGTLELKFGRFGVFLGCSQYPECRNTIKIDDLTNKNNGEDKQSDDSVKRFEPKYLGNDETSKLEIFFKIGPYGPYIQLGRDGVVKKPKRVAIPKIIKDMDKVDFELAKSLLLLPKTLGQHPETKENIVLGIGKFGPYLLHNKKYTSLKNEDDFLELTLSKAIALIQL